MVPIVVVVVLVAVVIVVEAMLCNAIDHEDDEHNLDLWQCKIEEWETEIWWREENNECWKGNDIKYTHHDDDDEEDDVINGEIKLVAMNVVNFGGSGGGGGVGGVLLTIVLDWWLSL